MTIQTPEVLTLLPITEYSTHCRSSCAERDFQRKTIYITEKMIFVVDKLAAKDTEKK